MHGILTTHDSVLPASDEEMQDMTESVRSVKLDLLYVEDQKHRLKLDIESLAESIEKIGQINPITVKKVGTKYRVISGRRRFSALTRLSKDSKTPIKALVYVKDIDSLHEELITIDENIMRQQLGDVELDEALYRRKQIYEELNPETKQHVSGGHAKATPAKKKAPFTRDAAAKLNLSRRSVEKAISRAAKASEAVKKARSQGLLQSKVDLLVTLDPDAQDLLLPVIKQMDLEDTRAMIEKTKRLGAKAAVLYMEDEAKEEPALKPLLKEADRFAEILKQAALDFRPFRGKTRFDNLKRMEELARSLDQFIEFQRNKLGVVRAISRSSNVRRIIRHG